MMQRSQAQVKEIIRKWYKVLQIPEQYDNDFYAYLESVTIQPDITAEGYEEKGGEENFLSCLYFCERLKEQYEEKGIDLKVLYDTLQELFLWTGYCSRRKGRLWLDNLWWVKLHLTMKLFRCSWLIDSKLKELLPADSNIMKFQEMFRGVLETESQETLHYVFGAGTTRENLAEKECNTSLAAKVRERVLSGETFHEGYGILKN